MESPTLTIVAADEWNGEAVEVWKVGRDLGSFVEVRRSCLVNMFEGRKRR